MRAADLTGPAYGSSHSYDLECLATIGLVAKGLGATAGNAAARAAPGAASSLGFGPRVAGAAEWFASKWTNPYIGGAMLLGAAPPVSDKCKCPSD